METVKKFREAALRTMRSAVSQNKRRLVDNHRGWDLDLSYITERIIAMGFPAVGVEAMYRNPRLGKKGVVSYLDQTHGTHYRVFNVCAEEKYQYEDDVFHGRVSVYPFYDHNPAPLFLVAGFCLEASQWLAAHPENVIVVHCKAGKGRTGFITACLLLQQGMAVGASAAIAMFTDKRVEVGRALNQPSQITYVRYWDLICQRNQAVVNDLNHEEMDENDKSSAKPRNHTSLMLPDPQRSELFLRCLFLSNANPDLNKLRIVFYQNGVFLTQRALRAKSGGTFLLFCNFELAGDIKVAIFSSPGEEEAEKELVMAAQEEQDKAFDRELGEGISAAAARTREELMRKATSIQNKVRSKLLVRYWFNTEFVPDFALEARKLELDVANVADSTGLFNDRTILRFGFTHSATSEFNPDAFLASVCAPAIKREPRAPPNPLASAANTGGRRGSFSRPDRPSISISTPSLPSHSSSLSSTLSAMTLSPSASAPAPSLPSLSPHPRLSASAPPPPPPSSAPASFSSASLHCAASSSHSLPPSLASLLPPSPPSTTDISPPGSPASHALPDAHPSGMRERSQSTSRKRAPPKPPAFKLTEEEAVKLPNWSASVTSPSGTTETKDADWDVRIRSRSRTASCSMQRLDNSQRERPPLPTFRTMPSHLPSHNAATPSSSTYLTPKALSSPRRAQSMPGESQDNNPILEGGRETGVWTTAFPFPPDTSPSPKSSSRGESFASAFEPPSLLLDERSRSPSTSRFRSLSQSVVTTESKASSAVSGSAEEEYPDFSRIVSEVTPVTGTSDLQEEDEGFDSGEDQGEEGATGTTPLDAPFRPTAPPPSPKVGERVNTEPRPHRPSPPPTIYETDGQPEGAPRRGSVGEGKSRLRERRRGVTVSSRSSLDTPRIPLAHLLRVDKEELDKQIAQYKRSLIAERTTDLVAAPSSRSLLLS